MEQMMLTTAKSSGGQHGAKKICLFQDLWLLCRITTRPSTNYCIMCSLNQFTLIFLIDEAYCAVLW